MCMMSIYVFKFTCRCTHAPAKKPKADAWHLHLLSPVLIEAGALAKAEYAVLASLASPLARGILSSWDGWDDRPATMVT